MRGQVQHTVVAGLALERGFGGATAGEDTRRIPVGVDAAYRSQSLERSRTSCRVPVSG